MCAASGVTHLAVNPRGRPENSTLRLNAVFPTVALRSAIGHAPRALWTVQRPARTRATRNVTRSPVSTTKNWLGNPRLRARIFTPRESNRAAAGNVVTELRIRNAI
jgi:hypothetical protein